MGIWPFTRSRARRDAELLLEQVQAASRRPVLFGPGGAPDTLEGRFELMTLFATLALVRMRTDPGSGPLAQHFTDVLFRNVDSGLREAGVGDLTVPKKMRKLAGAFYGRLEAYEGALAAKDAPALADVLSRNVGVSAAFAPELARLALATAAAQADQPVTALLGAEGWPAPAP